jgi:hypothetical protein
MNVQKDENKLVKMGKTAGHRWLTPETLAT